ncbi:DUF3325 family protein [Nitrobacter vulgaris]|jgi:hypothetical protein|uniref:DUF3325 domain-containing protein n=1 Tax=Nitrobacter vulgaris TaxID=29421 RepID=A0A1V4HVL7_NITVU|nr:DUF3325 family protein [Nitrobacter vulgaris]OPH82021.1 hypothetical protein B2M20_14815 [Nitrobacter vulgaris]
MLDALYLLAAFVANYIAFACLALVQRHHWHAVFGTPDCPRLGRLLLKVVGILSFATAFAVIQWREGSEYGILLWVTELPVAAALVVATLSFKPKLLKLLAALPARA